MVHHHDTTAQASLVDVSVMLAREDSLREAAKAEKAELELKIERQLQAVKDQAAQDMERLRKELTPLPPPELITPEQLATLQARLESMHTAKLLSDGDMYAVEDLISDFLEAEIVMGKITAATVSMFGAAASEMLGGKLHKMIGVSEGLASDAAFARQVRRKFV